MGTLEARPEQLTALLTEVAGGPDVIRALIQYHEEGMSYDQVSQYAGVSKSIIWARMGRARAKMRRCGVWPDRWDKKGAKGE